MIKYKLELHDALKSYAYVEETRYRSVAIKVFAALGL